MRYLPSCLLAALLASSAMADTTSPSTADLKEKVEIQNPGTCLKVNDMKLRVYPDNADFRRKTVSWRMDLQNSCTSLSGFEIDSTFFDKDGFELPSRINIMDLAGRAKIISPKDQTATGTMGVAGDTFDNAETVVFKLSFRDDPPFHQATFKIDDIYPDRAWEAFERFNHSCLQVDGGVTLDATGDKTNMNYNITPRACPTMKAVPVYGRIIISEMGSKETKVINIGTLDQPRQGTDVFQKLSKPRVVFEISPDATWKRTKTRRISLYVQAKDSSYTGASE